MTLGGRVLRSMWWLVGSLISSYNKNLTCGRCRNASEVIEFHPSYLKALGDAMAARRTGLQHLHKSGVPGHIQCRRKLPLSPLPHSLLKSLTQFTYANTDDSTVLPAQDVHPAEHHDQHALGGQVHSMAGDIPLATAVAASLADVELAASLALPHLQRQVSEQV